MQGNIFRKPLKSNAGNSSKRMRREWAKDLSRSVPSDCFNCQFSCHHVKSEDVQAAPLFNRVAREELFLGRQFFRVNERVFHRWADVFMLRMSECLRGLALVVGEIDYLYSSQISLI